MVLPVCGGEPDHRSKFGHGDADSPHDADDQHLKFISREAGPQVHVVLVLDRAGWHIAKALKVPKNVTLLHLPPYSPELNPVERIWGYLRSHHLSNRVYRDYNELFEETTAAWNRLDETRLQSLTATDWIRRAI